MIHLKFDIPTPFISQERVYEAYDSVFDVDRALTEHKKCYMMLSYFPQNIVEIEINIRWTGKDQSGPNLTLGFLGLVFEIGIYDTRYWDYEKEEWVENDF